MMHFFLANNRDNLIERCKVKVAARPQRAATTEQLANGVPLFLDQFTRTLEAEEGGKTHRGTRHTAPPNLPPMFGQACFQLSVAKRPIFPRSDILIGEPTEE